MTLSSGVSRFSAAGAVATWNSGRSSKPFSGVLRSSDSSSASTTFARSITLCGMPASFATWMP